MTLKHSLLALILMGAVACGGKDPPVDVGEEDTDIPLDVGNGATAPAPYAGVTWELDTVEAGQADHPVGDLGKLVRATDGTLYYAYLKNEASTSSDCTNLALFSGNDQVPGLRYQLHVAVKPPGGPFNLAIERLPVENASATGQPNFIGARLGLDAIVDASGDLLIVTPGGQNGQFTCAASDMLFGRRSTTGIYTVTTATDKSGECCAPCPPQSACLDGSDSGYFPSIAIRKNGTISVSYIDQHFVTDNDGKTDADFELVNVTGNSPGANNFEPIDLWSGAGYWGTLRFKDTLGLAAAASYNGVPQLFSSANGAAWKDEDLPFNDQVSGRVQLEIAPNGTIGIAYYEAKDQRNATTNDLVLCETTDLAMPFNCDRPENALLVAGAQPSLAYDSKSRPLLSYYYCGSGSCVHDGLRFAWRDDNGIWWKFNVHNVDNNRSGFWSSVQVDPITDEPTVVFQDLTKGSALVAYGHFVK